MGVSFRITVNEKGGIETIPFDWEQPFLPLVDLDDDLLEPIKEFAKKTLHSEKPMDKCVKELQELYDKQFNKQFERNNKGE